jgi:hypothetical protein
MGCCAEPEAYAVIHAAVSWLQQHRNPRQASVTTDKRLAYGLALVQDHLPCFMGVGLEHSTLAATHKQETTAQQEYHCEATIQACFFHVFLTAPGEL